MAWRAAASYPPTKIQRKHVDSCVDGIAGDLVLCKCWASFFCLTGPYWFWVVGCAVSYISLS